MELKTPRDVQRELAGRFKARRLGMNLTQEGLAARSGVAWSSLKRFEHRGLISLEALLKLAMVMDEAWPRSRSMKSCGSPGCAQKDVSSDLCPNRSVDRVSGSRRVPERGALGPPATPDPVRIRPGFPRVRD